ncbi:ferrous iron transport protein A [Candidatus Woesearchaeota archaeon]|nr:ferrous iron transport protein A [Candidatus Woesearchaeota archaeon]
MNLLELRNDEVAVIVGLDGGSAFKEKLSFMNIRLNKRIKKVATQPLSGPVIAEIDGRQVVLGRGIAGRILVRR